MFTFLLVVHAIIAAALVTVILMQRSEGGGLGMGSGPSGLMTARGAADFLSRATAVLATAFVLMAFLLAALASMRNSGGAIDTSLAGQGQAGPITAPAPAGAAPGAGAIPMMGGAPAATGANAPVPPGPDPVTAQALQPAAVGAPQQQQKAAVRPAPRAHTAADFRTIDTGAAAKGAIGIGGVTAAPKPADKPAPAPAAPAPAPGNSQ